MEKPPGSKRPPILLVLAIAGGVGWMISSAVKENADLEALGERFLGALAAGDVDEAYGMLSSKRRSRLPPEEFAALTDHPAFRHHTARWLGPMKSRPDGVCSIGGLEVDGKEWGVQLFFAERRDRWRVHSFAIQPPARMQLGVLLPECGYWEGTTAGYSGPGIARTTKPTP